MCNVMLDEQDKVPANSIYQAVTWPRVARGHKELEQFRAFGW